MGSNVFTNRSGRHSRACESVMAVGAPSRADGSLGGGLRPWRIGSYHFGVRSGDPPVLNVDGPPGVSVLCRCVLRLRQIDGGKHLVRYSLQWRP